MSALLSILADWKPVRALVVGDYMLDQLVYGDAERLSPDAPVPVLAVRRTEDRPGGASNVCLDLAAMRARVWAVGVVGADAEGAALRAALERAGVDAGGLVVDPGRPTTLKRSLVGLAQHRHPQKMFRMDLESRAPLSDRVAAAALERVDEALRAGVDVVCLEDYAKGVCCEAVCRGVIERCRAAGVPVLVDPAAIDDYSRYAGATCVTPNRNEAALAAGDPEEPLAREDGEASDALLDHWARLARGLSEKHDFEAVVLTLDRHGALLLQRGGAPVRLPTVARKVYDVTGAGDMVLAALAAARGNGCSWPDAVRFANAAAGLEVEVFGVEPIPLERIHRFLLEQHGGLDGKLRTLPEVLVEVAALRREGRSIVFTNGCFDVVHAGHVALLRFAAQQGDFVVVGLNDDDSVRRLKGPSRPVHAARDRAAVLGEMASVGAVVLFAEDTPQRLIEAVRPDVLVKGGDYTPDRVVGRELVESWGGRVAIAPMLEGRSTSAAVARLNHGVPG